MPALKMKSKSSTECLKHHDLQACRMLTKPLKVSRSQVKTFQQAEVLDASIQNCHDVPANIEVFGQTTTISEDNEFLGLSDGDSSNLLRVSSSSTDTISLGRMGSLSATCSSNLETIFSPNFEQSDSQPKPINNSNAVKDGKPDLPHLVADDSDDGNLNDFQTCSVLDFHISDSVSSLLFDNETGLIDDINAACPIPECMDSDIMIDMAERYMILPFLGKTMETGNIHEGSVEDTKMDSDDACLYLAIHQLKSSDQETEMNHSLGEWGEIECFDPQSVFRDLPDLSESVSSICPIWLTKESKERKPVTLVLDLDETLVHSTLEHCDDADFTFPVFFNMKQHTVYVRRRPYLQVFLERVAQMFEIVIFTASQSIYAQQLLDILDPERKLISRRIYRESCIFSDGSYTKDLTILGVDLAKVVIIDNSPQVFQLQVNNGIPIKSWFDDPSDHALIQLLPFLETLVDADDVRPLIAKRFGNEG